MISQAAQERADRHYQTVRSAHEQPKLLTVKEVLVIIRKGKTQFYGDIVKQASFPRPTRIGARNLYLKSEVEAWYYSQRI